MGICLSIFPFDVWDKHWVLIRSVPEVSLLIELTGWFLLLRIFSVAISVNPHVCFNLDLILISVFLR